MPYIPSSLKTRAFIAGKAELYNELCVNPELRQVPIHRLDRVRADLKDLVKNYRVRYRGPRYNDYDTKKCDATSFTVYIQGE
jgi:hypothetical protein